MLQENLINDKYWTSNLYLPLNALGHCYTYDPPEDGMPLFDGGIGLFLGHRDADNVDLHQNHIYIHEKGQLWPNEKMPSLLRFKQHPNLITQVTFQAVKSEKVRFLNN